jgi:hypothetical protein
MRVDAWIFLSLLLLKVHTSLALRSTVSHGKSEKV